MTTPLTPPAPSAPRTDELTHLNALDNGYQEVAEYVAYGLFRSCVEAYLKHATRPAQAALSEEEIDTSLLREAIAFHEQGWTPFSSEIELYVKAAKILIERMKRALTAAQNRSGR